MIYFSICAKVICLFDNLDHLGSLGGSLSYKMILHNNKEVNTMN